MITKYPKERISKANQELGDSSLYHQTLTESLPAWKTVQNISGFSGVAIKVRSEAESLKDLIEHKENQQGGIVDSARLDLVRSFAEDRLDQMTLLGSEIIEKELVGIRVHTKRGKLVEPSCGIVFEDGSRVDIPKDEHEELAALHFKMEQYLNGRSALIVPTEYLNGQGFLQISEDATWEELEANSKNRHYQKAYEISTALALLKRAANDEYQSIINSSRSLLRLSNHSNQPALLRYPLDFQERFCRDQKDFAWSWRNMLEPGKSHIVPDLNKRDHFFRNQIGLGMLEYLTVIGQEGLNYLRNFGQAMRVHPFQRTEIRNFTEWLPGVPLKDGTYLRGSPELFLFIAREHHELWRFCRELSWVLPDPSYHQPPRHEHKPWDKLRIDTMNKDLLSAFGICYLLALSPEEDFKLMLENTAPGNPLNFNLTIPEIS